MQATESNTMRPKVKEGLLSGAKNRLRIGWLVKVINFAPKPFWRGMRTKGDPDIKSPGPGHKVTRT